LRKAAGNSSSTRNNSQIKRRGRILNENRRLERHILDALRASHLELKNDLAGFVTTLSPAGKQKADPDVRENWERWANANRDELLSVFADFSQPI
jgi:hypothetical protein